MNFDDLRKTYPKVITLDQFYRIAHISKRKANWLLTNGVIPCEDSGKKTRRFKICLDDAIDYLQKVQSDSPDVWVPCGIFGSGYKNKTLVEYLDCDKFLSFILEYFDNYPDMLTIKQTKEISGYCTTTIQRWVSQNKVAGVFYYGKCLLSKESFAQFLASKDGQRIANKSDLHREMMEKFVLMQKNSDTELSMSL